MARLSLLLSLLSLVLLASAASHDVAPKHKRSGKRHGKRCSPSSASSSLSSTSTSVASTTTWTPNANVAPSPSTTWTPPSSSDDSWTSTSSSPAWTPTSSSAAPAATTAAPPATVNAGGNKCGAGWPNGDDGTILTVIGDCTWYHTWSVYPVNTQGKLNFAAVFWGPAHVSDWSAGIASAGAEVAMFFNEPNESGQSNIDPYSAVPYWQNNFQWVKDQLGIRLGSAATSSNPNGMTWMNEFIGACTGCTIDFMCLHWYGTTVSDFQTYVELWHSTYNLPIWVTEFACQNFVNLDQQCTDIPDFMSQAVSWLDQQDYVEHHAWFGFMRDMQGVNPADGLMNQDGSLTSLGFQYVYSS